MRLAVCSSFNNSLLRGDLWRYLRQVEALERAGIRTRIYAVEGDSRDLTYPALRRDPLVHSLLKLDFGAPVKGSVVDRERMLHCITVAGVARAAAIADGWADWILWVESDLIWGYETVARLLDAAAAHPNDLVSPWVAIQGHGDGCTDLARLEAWPRDDVIFYDTWAFRRLPDGRHVGPFEPPPEGLEEMQATGSCLLCAPGTAAESNVISEQAIVGWCEAARARGHRVWCDGGAPRLAPLSPQGVSMKTRGRNVAPVDQYLVKLLEQFIAESHPEPGFTFFRGKMAPALVHDPQLHMWLWTEYGRPIGYGHIATYADRRKAHVCRLGVCVDGAYRGQGLGTEIVGYLIERARGMSRSKLVATVYGDNQPMLHIYWDKHGFITEGRYQQEERADDGTMREVYSLARFLETRA